MSLRYPLPHPKGPRREVHARLVSPPRRRTRCFWMSSLDASADLSPNHFPEKESTALSGCASPISPAPMRNAHSPAPIPSQLGRMYSQHSVRFKSGKKPSQRSRRLGIQNGPSETRPRSSSRLLLREGDVDGTLLQQARHILLCGHGAR